ncbi:MAG TPA: ComF family protein [Ignavibacteriales bacterium]|nr:ComF family protein [Ignavibacteriales bacterium]HOL80578.1 ComF family protein [Ignavibacteriales bacterium]HOM64268.1 ComF family protein [Ignavibacteriales bacterium]HPD68437.1 ComF family protein [Ignavibacteriales bacterium]HPP33086.1 ComF family protein [Ignavibacteriales bacterium]
MEKIKKIKDFITPILDFFLPRTCPGCQEKLSYDEIIICSKCNAKIEKLNQQELQAYFQEKFENEKLIEGFVSLFLFEKKKSLQHAVHLLKYKDRTDIGIYFGEKLARFYETEIKYLWQIDLIIPVPLHKVKYRERGYNQSYYIAKGIGDNLNIQVDTTSFQRVTYTSTQTKLDKTQRKKNVNGVFDVIVKNNIENKNILLVDDIVTTGATTLECAKILKDNAAKSIYLATIAIANK